MTLNEARCRQRVWAVTGNESTSIYRLLGEVIAIAEAVGCREDQRPAEAVRALVARLPAEASQNNEGSGR